MTEVKATLAALLAAQLRVLSPKPCPNRGKGRIYNRYDLQSRGPLGSVAINTLS